MDQGEPDNAEPTKYPQQAETVWKAASSRIRRALDSAPDLVVVVFMTAGPSLLGLIAGHYLDVFADVEGEQRALATENTRLVKAGEIAAERILDLRGQLESLRKNAAGESLTERYGSTFDVLMFEDITTKAAIVRVDPACVDAGCRMIKVGRSRVGTDRERVIVTPPQEKRAAGLPDFGGGFDVPPLVGCGVMWEQATELLIVLVENDDAARVRVGIAYERRIPDPDRPVMNKYARIGGTECGALGGSPAR